MSNIEKLNECLGALSRRVQFANFVRRASFAAPIDACMWAFQGNAHAPFTAFITDGRTILVQPLPANQWHWTEHVCRVSNERRPKQDPDGLLIPDRRY